MEFTEKGLILKVGRFREADLWVRFLSPSRGMMTAFAFGGCKSRRRFCGCLDPMRQVLLTVKSDKGGRYNTLEEGSLIHGFPGLRSDNGRLGLAVNCVKFVESVQVGPQGARMAYDLLLDTLHAIEGMKEPFDSLPVMFRAKATFEQGYRPDFLTCLKCGSALCGADIHCFDIERGGAVCRSCATSEDRERGGISVSFGTLRALDWIQGNGPQDWARLCLPPEVRRECYDLVERFVAYHLGLVWENGYYKKI